MATKRQFQEYFAMFCRAIPYPASSPYVPRPGAIDILIPGQSGKAQPQALAPPRPGTIDLFVR